MSAPKAGQRAEPGMEKGGMKQSRLIGWLTVVVALWSAACAAPLVTRPVFHEGEDGKAEVFIRLDKVTTADRFDQPAQIPPARLRELLATVAVQRRTGLLSVIFSEQPFRAFSNDQLNLLSVQLSKALAEATPDEQAVFFFNDPESNQRFRITSGGVSVQQGKLVVVMANYRYAILWGDPGGGSNGNASLSSARDNPLYAYPDGTYQLVVGAGQERLGGEQGWFRRWFGGPERRSGVLLALNAPATPAAEEQSGETTGQQAPTPEAASAPPGASPAPAPSATVPPPAAPGTQSIVPAPPGPPAAVSPLEDKLRELKKLRDEGLITDADYEAKKQELLKNF